MSLKMTGIYKAYQPGDVATFDHAEAHRLVAAGLARVHEPEHEFELALVDLQDTLPGAQLSAAEGTAAMRPSIAEPSTMTGRAIPAAMTPASGAPGVILDGGVGHPALERATATPDPLPGRDPHAIPIAAGPVPNGDHPLDPSVAGVEMASRGASSGVGIAARGDPYAAAHAVTAGHDEAGREGDRGDNDRAKGAEPGAATDKPHVPDGNNVGHDVSPASESEAP